MSTWIISPPLGSNVIHCVEFPQKMGKISLNLALGEPLFWVKKLPCIDDLIEFYVLLLGILHFGVHDMIHYILFNAIMIDFNGGQLVSFIKVSNRGGKYGRSSSALNTRCNQGKGGHSLQNNFHPQPLW